MPAIPDHEARHLAVCERCNRAAPLRHVGFQQVIGTGYWFVIRTFQGEFCRRCTDAAFLRASTLSLLFGWWGPGVFVTPFVVLWNIVTRLAALFPGAYEVRPRRAARQAAPEDAGEPMPMTVDLSFEALPPVKNGRAWAAEWWLAMSHLRSRKSEDFISMTTAFSILGVVVGVAVLNWVLAVMTGFEIDIRDKILGANAHIVVLSYAGNVPEDAGVVEAIDAVPGILAAAPFTYTEMMIRSPLATSGVILKGMDPGRTGLVTSLRDDLELGLQGELKTPEQKAAAFAAMAHDIPPPEGADPDETALPGILIGRELQGLLQVAPGDKVQIINPLGTGTGIMGLPTPTVRSFRVAGVFFSGMYEYDTKWTYVDNEVAQSFLRIGDTWTGVEIRVADIDAVQDTSREIEQKLGYPYYTRHWKNLNQALFEALAMERFVMGLILSTIVGVAGLAIITTLVMLVITKGREIAILKAMGASRWSILRIFVIEGTLIGLVGTTVGTVFGLLGCEFLERYKYPLKTDVYYLSSLPVVVDPTTVAVIAGVAFLICFFATLYPAWQASSLNPVEGLRYE